MRIGSTIAPWLRWRLRASAVIYAEKGRKIMICISLFGSFPWLLAAVFFPLSALASWQPNQTEDQKLGQAANLAGFRLSKLDLAGMTAFKREDLLAQFSTRPGDSYKPARIKRGLEKIKTMYAEKGYMDSSCVPEQRIDRARKALDLTLMFNEGVSYYVHRITIVGSPDKSHDRRLRVALSSIEEGKTFRPSGLAAAIAALNRLDLFEKLGRNDFELEKDSKRAVVNILFRVKPRTSRPPERAKQE